jgi:UDP-N-acetylmuramyl pentapeptide phosphotransferase/UDP-N-acetylglucosamine-1-phosphate transferase
MSSEIAAVVACAIASFFLVGGVRWLALRHDIIDHPTDRSSHAHPTPRGGGLGLVAAALAFAAWRTSEAGDWLALLAIMGAVPIALVGWIDDRRGLSVRIRLLVHSTAGVIVGAVAATTAHSPAAAIALLVCWAFWTVSAVNLVNFMDGINGLVASQVAIFAFSLAAFPDPTGVNRVNAALVGAACLGFLPWNFPRARIFLGDVGSGALGYLVVALALLSVRSQSVGVVQAYLPLLALFGDATVTILRRWKYGERLTAPHRSHLYQRLANGGMGHSRVTALYAAAAACGVLVAHSDRFSLMSGWCWLYVAAVGLTGVLLDRRASAFARALT